MRPEWWLGCALALAACDEPPRPTGLGPIASDAGDYDAGRVARMAPAYAVISSDWTSSAISILDAEGNLLADNYLNSGSTRSGLVTTLSGDVELPTRSGEDGVMVVLDRFRTDVITRIRLSDGALLGQVKTHTPPDQGTTSSFSSNPHDYVYIDPQTAWVTRSEPNLDPTAPAIDRGNDLLRIDPSTMQRTSDRIDLSLLDARTSGPAGEVTLYARPSRMVRVGRTLVVGLVRSAFDFRAVGDGMVALVDLDTRTVTGLPIPGLKSCSDIQRVPNDIDSVLVTCGGDWNAESTARSAGLVLLGIANGGASIEQTFRASDDLGSAPLVSATVALGGTLVGAGANDFSGSGPDVYAVLDLATGSKTLLTSISPGAGVFGRPAFDVETGTLLLPDASQNKDKRPTAGLRRFLRNADGSFRELPLVTVAVSTDMPVRHVFPL
jgi:hypothetical protein